MVYKGVDINIELSSLKENETLQCAFCSLLEAILKVKKEYLEYSDPIKNVYISHYERVFAYELYHQWSTVLKKEKLDQDYIINAEVGKNTSYFGKIDHGVKFPDMVLHHNHGDNLNQGIICEIKRKEGLDYYSLRNDLEKLSYFLNNEKSYGFALGVFILVREDFETIRQYVHRSRKGLIGITQTKEAKEFQKRIICLTYKNERIDFSDLQSILKNTSRRYQNEYSAALYNRKMYIVLNGQ